MLSLWMLSLGSFDGTSLNGQSVDKVDKLWKEEVRELHVSFWPPTGGCVAPSILMKFEVWERWISMTGGQGTAFHYVQWHFSHGYKRATPVELVTCIQTLLGDDSWVKRRRRATWVMIQLTTIETLIGLVQHLNAHSGISNRHRTRRGAGNQWDLQTWNKTWWQQHQQQRSSN